jgi:hypothetical protein
LTNPPAADRITRAIATHHESHAHFAEEKLKCFGSRPTAF